MVKRLGLQSTEVAPFVWKCNILYCLVTENTTHELKPSRWSRSKQISDPYTMISCLVGQSCPDSAGDTELQQILTVFNCCLLKQSDGKLSQTSMLYLNYLIIVIWHFLNHHKMSITVCAIFIKISDGHVHSMTLRSRAHNFSPPKCRLQSARNSFINRILFACVQCSVYFHLLRCTCIIVNQSDWLC